MVLKKIYALCFADTFQLGLFLPVIYPHLISLGGTTFLHGALGSLNALLQFISNTIIGSLSDTKGRKTLLIKTIPFTILANALLLFEFLPVYILTRVIVGVSSQIQVLIKPLVADHIPKEEQVSVFTNMGAIFGISFILAPVIGGHITSHENGFKIVAILLCLLSILSLIIVLTLPEKKIDKVESAEKDKKSGGLFANFKKIKYNALWDLFLIKLLGDIAFMTFFSNIGIVLRHQFNASQKEIGYFIAYLSLCSILANIFMKKIKNAFYSNDETGRQRLVQVYMLAGTLFSTLYLFPTYLIYILALGLVGFMKSIIDSTLIEVLITRIEEHEKGTVMSAFDSILQLSNLGIPLIAGYISQTYGSHATLSLIIPPAFLNMFVAMVLKDRKVKKT